MRIGVLFVAGLLAVGGVVSCKSDENAVKEAEEKVFAVHDDVMGKMGDIMTLKKQINQRVATIDSTKEAGSAAGALRTDEEREQAMRLRKNLTDADSVMMAWMSGYNGDTLTKLPADKALQYLSAQKDQIDDVKTKVNSSIEQARAFLGKN